MASNSTRITRVPTALGTSYDPIHHVPLLLLACPVLWIPSGSIDWARGNVAVVRNETLENLAVGTGTGTCLKKQRET